MVLQISEKGQGMLLHYRKLIIGVLFMCCSTGIIVYGIHKGVDLLMLSSTILSMATGVGAVVYGNVLEHRTGNGGGKDTE